MGYVALYRKFRPTTFAEVKGQDPIVTTLQNQLRMGRIGHAYLFCGTRGTGKTTVAKILARAVNCMSPQEDGSPCNVCTSCQTILSGTSTNVLEIDAASNNGVDNIREIREEVAYRPTQGRFKVYIIDEAHMLSSGAWNALLKTLEEPPEYVLFLLATTEAAKIPITILSRCQRYNFRRISAASIAAHLQDLIREEGAEAEEEATRYIARVADGSMRDALSLLDQYLSFYPGEKLTYGKTLDVLGRVDTDTFSHLLRRVLSGDAAGSVRLLQEAVQDGREVSQFISDFTWYLRNLLLVQSSEDAEDLLDVSTENVQQLREESALLEMDTVLRYIRVLSDCSNQLRMASQKQILAETALIQLCRPQMETDQLALLDRVRQLEQKWEEGLPMQMASQETAGERARSTREGIHHSPEKEKPEPPPKKVAAPEDLKVITAHWRQILGATSHLTKAALSKAGAPRYDSATGAPVLYLEVEDPISREKLAAPDQIEELKQMIAHITGQELEYQIEVVGTQHPAQLEKIPLEERLAQEIRMPIKEG